MKVLFVTAGYLGASNAISIRSRFNVKALREHGFDVEVLTVLPDQGTAQADGSSTMHGVLASRSFSDGGFVRRLATEVVLGIRFSGRLWSLRRRVDIAILTSPPFFSNVICGWACALLRIPYVVDVRDRYPQVLFDLGVLAQAGWAGRWLRRLERSMYARAHAVVVATNGLARQIEQELPTRVEVLRNGYDADLFSDRGRSGPRGEGPFRILIHGLFGRLFDERAFLDIAAHCARHAPAHLFVLAGQGPKLESVLSAGLPNVTSLGELEHAQVLDLLATVDLGMSVHTSSAVNSFPVKVFEYIGAGLPSMVLPRSEAGLEIERSGMGWSFDPEQAEACAKWLTELIREPGRLLRATERVLLHRVQYSRQHQARVLVGVLHRWKETSSRGS